MTYKSIYIFFLFLFMHHLCLAQDEQLIFFEPVKDDSVMMYISKTYRFTEKDCAAYIRHTRIDSAGNFNGYFEDNNQEKGLSAKGYYANGQKHGYFEIFYPDGNIKCRGNYDKNLPTGKWEFFYENGSTDRTIMLSEKDTLLIDLFDEHGKKIVENGFGEFNGLVAGLYNTAEYPHPITAAGKVEHGKPTGKWIATFLNDQPYCSEEFENGRIITGFFPASVMGRIVNYSDRSYLNTFFLDNYLRILESFLTSHCGKNTTYIKSESKPAPVFSFDIKRFNSDLRSQLNRQIESDLNHPSYKWDYREGDNELTLRFKINNEGKAYDFVLASGWGQRLTDIIQQAIRKQVFPSNTGSLTFRLTLHFPGGQFYQYSFDFTRNE